MGVNDIVFGPGGLDGTGEGEDVLGVEAAIAGRSGAVPVAAVLHGFVGIVAKESGRIGVVHGTADMLEAPGEGSDETVVVGLPPACLVAMNASCEPVHRKWAANSLPFSEQRENLELEEDFTTPATEKSDIR